MSSFNRVVFEDGKGGLRDEEGVELMEVDELDVQVRKLVTMEYYLNQQLATKFDDLQAGKSTVHEFIRDDMGFTFKRAAFHSLKRNDEGAIEARYEWAKKIVKLGMSFLKSCVFIDESGFHINMNRNGAWARKEETPVVKVENTRDVFHTIFSAILAYAVVNISIRTPSVPTTQLVPVEVGKNTKLGNGKTQKPKPKGTTQTITCAS
ncbi:hypothetical protein RMCBS344292_09210 [Rhizopus microsporus]|nr:hypothetical protein RMCBS344292_09210 [Rhizopus microsporus]